MYSPSGLMESLPDHLPMPRRNGKTNRRKPAASKGRRQKKKATLSLTNGKRMGGAILPAIPLSYHRLAGNVARYIESLFRDRLCDALELPTMGFTHRYMPMSYSTRFSLTAGTTIANAAVGMNPYHAVFGTVDYDKPNSAAGEINVFVPTLFTNTSANTNGSIPNGAEQAGVVLNGQFSSTSAEPYEADVRVHGVRFRINYYGTELNKGGLIYAIHNSANKSLLCQFETDNSAATNGSLSSWTNVLSLSNATDLCQTANLSDSFEFVWRPQHLNFERVQSHYAAIGAHATVASGNTELAAHDILPTVTDITRPCPRGWVTGFVIVPATATAATAIPYSVDVEMICDVRLSRMDSATAANVGYSVLTGVKTPVEDPVLTAHCHNALAHLHASRQARAIPSRQRNLSVSPPSGLMSQVKRMGESALEGAAENLGSRLAAAF